MVFVSGPIADMGFTLTLTYGTYMSGYPLQPAPMPLPAAIAAASIPTPSLMPCPPLQVTSVVPVTVEGKPVLTMASIMVTGTVFCSFTPSTSAAIAKAPQVTVPPNPVPFVMPLTGMLNPCVLVPKPPTIVCAPTVVALGAPVIDLTSQFICPLSGVVCAHLSGASTAVTA